MTSDLRVIRAPTFTRNLTGLLIAALLVSSSTPARAEFPFALRTSIGGGMGGGVRSSASMGVGAGGLATADLSWRPRPGHEWVLTYERGDVSSLSSRLVRDPIWDMVFTQTDRIGYEAVLVGIGRATPGSGFHRYLQAGIGVGRSFDGWRPPSTGNDGVALGANAGVRFVPAPGPVGFVFGIRTSHLFAGADHVHLFALTLGLTIHPVP